MEEKKRSKLIGLLSTLLVHLAVIAVLLLISFSIPEHTEESGVSIVMGDTKEAYGGFDPASLVDVKVAPQETVAAPQEPSEQELVTQVEEETVAIPPQKTAEELAAEARRLAEEQAERERKAAAEEANRRVAGAFNRGSEMGSRGTTSGTGSEGDRTGETPTGVTSGATGYGSFDLGGRSLGEDGLPRPAYEVQEEAKVVVNITVNPGGFVISTSINPQTNTVNSQLRRAAEEAAKRARFNSIDGLNNQIGTITYNFKLK